MLFSRSAESSYSSAPELIEEEAYSKKYGISTHAMIYGRCYELHSTYYGHKNCFSDYPQSRQTDNCYWSVHTYRVSGCQINSQASSSGTQQEHKNIRPETNKQTNKQTRALLSTPPSPTIIELEEFLFCFRKVNSSSGKSEYIYFFLCFSFALGQK